MHAKISHGYAWISWFLKSRVLNFAFRKFGLCPIYDKDLNRSPFKYYISILGGGDVCLGHAYFVYLVEVGFLMLEKYAYMIFEHFLLPNIFNQNRLY